MPLHESRGMFFGTPGGNISGCALVPTTSGRTAALRAAGPLLLKYQARAPALVGVWVWYFRWESNPQRPLRRGLLYPFNYGSNLYGASIRTSVSLCTTQLYYTIPEEKSRIFGTARKNFPQGSVTCPRGVLSGKNFISLDAIHRSQNAFGGITIDCLEMPA